ncbi:ornithine--oxo-acid transaminase [Terrilactibacillus sp. S3-3]|nr:ornithine--oxo-acid transaminase [Terrilactibacillus sp. S3-3]
MSKTEAFIALADKHGANNYHPLPIVITKAEGVWVWDPEGNRYLDMLSGYSAVSQGHRHPKIIRALKEQADRVTLTSRAFYNDQIGAFFEKVAALTNKERVLPMNTGAEAVETAFKMARRWGYEKKGIPNGQAEIIACQNNFHGRTMGVISMSSSPENKDGFGPMLAGVKTIPYGDTAALEEAITPNTAAFIVEPIQGEAGIVIPPNGYLTEALAICKKNNVLFIADEIQTGLARTGKRFASDWENIVPDAYILGKALGGGVIPVSCVAANEDVLGVFTPGSHGSTFGGNPLACAVAVAALEVLDEEKLAETLTCSRDYFIGLLRTLDAPVIKEVRGKGLFIGIELTQSARPYCESLKELGLLCKETHENVIRFAPPLVIKKDEIDWAFERIQKLF